MRVQLNYRTRGLARQWSGARVCKCTDDTGTRSRIPGVSFRSTSYRRLLHTVPSLWAKLGQNLPASVEREARLGTLLFHWLRKGKRVGNRNRRKEGDM